MSLQTRLAALATAVGTDVKTITAAQSAQITIARMAPGSTLVIDYYKTVFGAANAWPATRPTSRTDLDVVWRGPSDPGDSLMLPGDVFDYVQGG